MKKIILFLLSLFLLTGCYNYRELNELAIASALGIDYIDNQYLITAQIMTLKKEGNNASQSSSIYKGTGHTIEEAINDINTAYPRDLYLSHMELLIIGKGMLQTNIAETFDFFLREPEIVLEFKVLAAASNTAYEILNQKIAVEQFTAKGIVEQMESTADKTSSIINNSFEEFISDTLEQGKIPMLTSIKLIKKETTNSEQELDVYNSLILEKTVMLLSPTQLAFLSKEETSIYNIITNNAQNIAVRTTYDNKPLSVEARSFASDVTLQITDNHIKINIKVTGKGEIIEIKTNKFTKGTQIMKEISDVISNNIKQQITELINRCQKENIDILHFKNIIYKKYFKKYDIYKERNICDIADITVDVDVSIFNSGNTYYGITED